MRARGRDGRDAERGTGMGAGERERKGRERVLCLGARKGRGGMVEGGRGGGTARGGVGIGVRAWASHQTQPISRPPAHLQARSPQARAAHPRPGLSAPPCTPGRLMEKFWAASLYQTEGETALEELHPRLWRQRAAAGL